MPTPELNAKGVLPPANGAPYPTTSLEFCPCYGTSSERRTARDYLNQVEARL